MRTRGLVDAAGGLGASDHVCWVYGSDREARDFRAEAARFGAEGLALGQRMVYVADRRDDDILADLTPMGDVADLRRRGALVLRRLADAYPGGGPVREVDAQRGAYLASMQQALEVGFRGIRAVVEASGLVAQPAWVDHQLAWEQAADRQMADDRRMAAICAYDRRVVGDEGASALACVHPAYRDPVVGFSLHAGPGGGVCLEGEVDAFQAPLLARALAATPSRPVTVLDVSGLALLDAAGASTLAHHADRLRAAGRELHIEGASPLVRKVWHLLGFSQIQGVRFR
jgi:anti-anti-sigma factor